MAVAGAVTGLFDKVRTDDRGQGSVEYVGIIVAVVIIVGLVIAAATSSDLGNTIINRIKDEIASI
ncbi:Flp family type IVb pilin [Cellulomonas sp. Sa3CUA2]|uniref:Flp family type IVb pilin n=1 Tax=Cellulomonas avistercoris TaxID=2762242 RepID=A0ABR8QD87_9CELL|nr:Flp family type IVb pilin [Cellulomonas avistercoris]